MDLMKIEKRKYKNSREFLIFLLLCIITIGIISINLFSNSFKTTMNNSHHSWYKLFDSYFFIKTILSPIFITSVVGKAIEIENNNNMWKIIKSSGVKFNKIYYTKFIYCLIKIFVYQLLEWILVISYIKFFGLRTSFPLQRMLFSFLTQFCVSFLLCSIHYVISLKWSNQLISVSIAIIGSLLGILSLLLPDIFSLLNPYSWYGRLIVLGYDMTTKNTYIMEFEYKFLFLSLIIGILINLIGPRLKGEDI